MSAETSNAGTAATSASAGWGRDYWWRRSNSAGSRGTSKSRYSSENWNLLLRITSKLQDGERRRKVGYTGVAPFNGIPGDPSHPFYERLNRILEEHDFDSFVED